MNEILNLEFSGFGVVKILFFGILLFLVLRLLHRVISIPRIEKPLRVKLNRAFPFVELIIWGVFLIWASRWFFVDQPVYTIIVASAIVLIFLRASWFAIGDVIAGIILKMEDAYEVEQQIRVQHVEGKIKKMGYRSLEVATKEGEIVKIPYGSIAGDMRVLSEPGEAVKGYSFKIEWHTSSSVPEALEKIRTLVLNAPWSSLKKEPQIKPVGEIAGQYIFEVIIHTPGEAYSRKVEEYVKKKTGVGKEV